MKISTGEQIKAVRKRAGITQAELADKLGISYVGVSQWENGLRNPKFETLVRIADALGVSYFDLMPDYGFDLSASIPPFSESEELSALEGTIAHIRVACNKLNPVGQKEAIKRVEELTEIPRYRKDTPPPEPPENAE